MKQVQMLVAGALAVFFTSCTKDVVVGEGPVVTEERNIISDYDGIELEMPGTVYFKQDSVYKVEVSAQRNVLEEMQTFVSDNHLVIRLVHGIQLRSHKPVQVLVSSPRLHALQVSGSGAINTTNAITTDALHLDLSGSGNITVSGITAGYANAFISGSGAIKMGGGTIEEETLDVTGSGTMDFSDVAAKKAETKTSGSGDIRLQVRNELKVRITGSGSVYYIGNPVIDMHISGSGKLVHL